MQKMDLIRAVMELNRLKILSHAQSFECVKQIINKTIQGTNKNFDVNKGEYTEKSEEQIEYENGEAEDYR
jgi:hypothetical protein